jgi:two-component system sensor histidine kinase KdpD
MIGRPVNTDSGRVPGPAPLASRNTGFGLLLAVGAVGVASAVSWMIEPYVSTVEIVMVFLLAVIVVAFRTDILPALAAVILAVGSFDVLFVLPKLTFSVQDTAFLITFGVMALVGITVATLNARVRTQSSQLAALEVDREKEQLRAALLSSVSHDLRTPLGTILAAATTLLDTGTRLSEERRIELLRAIEFQADHLGRLLRNLLEMTRLDRDPRIRAPEPYAVEEIVETAIRGLDRAARDRITAIRTPTTPAFANLDPVALEIVLSNLLENAIKYSPEAEPIEVTVDVREDAVVVEVRDHGPGVPTAERDRVFDKFTRGDHEGILGAGLGLAIARVIVEAHQGSVFCRDPDAGEGVVFGFSLPRVDLVAPAEEVAHE